MVNKNYLAKIEEIIEKQHGMLFSSNLTEHNIPRVYIKAFLDKGLIERVSRGVYVSTLQLEDEMFMLQKKYPKLIYSHETALYLHGLSDRTPLKFSMTVPSSYKVVDTISNKYKIYFIKKEYIDLGVKNGLSSMGNPVRVYNIERTICDCVRSRNRMDKEILSNALQRYVQLPNSDITLLLDYARKLRVESIIRMYLEVLL